MSGPFIPNLCAGRRHAGMSGVRQDGLRLGLQNGLRRKGRRGWRCLRCRL
jgi:hypothetical protein